MPRPRKLSLDEETLLRAALEGLELQRQRIEAQIDEIRRRLGGAPAAKPVKAKAARATRRKRTLSPEARKRISEAQKKRWAEYHKKVKGKEGGGKS